MKYTTEGIEKENTLTNFMPPTNQVGSPFSIVHEPELEPPAAGFAFFAGPLSSGPESELLLSRRAFFLSFGISDSELETWSLKFESCLVASDVGNELFEIKEKIRK